MKMVKVRKVGHVISIKNKIKRHAIKDVVVADKKIFIFRVCETVELCGRKRLVTAILKIQIALGNFPFKTSLIFSVACVENQTKRD